MTVRSFLALGLVAFLYAIPSLGQIHGTPASVSSIGFGGNFSNAPGVPASVTSLGPNGFSRGSAFIGNFGGFAPCCFNRQQAHPPLFDRHRFGHRGLRGNGFFPGVPVYAVPYAQYVVAEPSADDSYDRGNYDREEDEDYDEAGPTVFERHGSRLHSHVVRKEDSEAVASGNAAPPGPATEAEVVSPQPSTVLIFKDGHQTEVQNYAIVSDTLFELSEGRSHKIQLADLDLPATAKANDDRGVDFQVPAIVQR